MNARIAIAGAMLMVLVGCAPGQKYIEKGNDLASQGDFQGSLNQLEAAVAAEPDNLAYRQQLVRAKARFVNLSIAQADELRRAGQYDAAQRSYEQVLVEDPANVRAHDGIKALLVDREHAVQLVKAQSTFDGKHADTAMTMVRAILAEDPDNQGALKLKRDIEQADPQRDIPLGLRESLRKPVTLEFHDADIKSVFEALSRSTGVNFVFDREVKPDLKVTVFLQQTTVEDAIGVLTVTNQLEKKFLNDNTVLIYPNTTAKQRDYQDLMVKTFYLANADAPKIVQMLKTVLKTRDVYADEKLNSVTVRDTPGAVRLVEKMIAAQDLAEPEVTLEVEVLEVSRTRLTSLGVDPPSTFTLLNIVPSPTETVATNGAVVTNVNPVTTTTQLTVDNLRHFNGGNIGIPNPSVNIRSELGDSNLLANPRIRVKNRTKAHVLIGDKVPVITTTTTANVGVSESVSYLDVGLQLDVEPNVYLNNEVGIKIGLEVSSITREVTSKSGTLTYQIGTRSATTELRLADGETQALAGLINDQERHSSAGIPGLIDLPLVNRLFATTNDQHDKTEIVLLITPHIVRNISNSQSAALEFPAGTDSTSGTTALQLRSSSTMSAPPLGSSTGIEAGQRRSTRAVTRSAPGDNPESPAPAPSAPPAPSETPAAPPNPEPPASGSAPAAGAPTDQAATPPS